MTASRPPRSQPPRDPDDRRPDDGAGRRNADRPSRRDGGRVRVDSMSTPRRRNPDRASRPASAVPNRSRRADLDAISRRTRSRTQGRPLSRREVIATGAAAAVIGGAIGAVPFLLDGGSPATPPGVPTPPDIAIGTPPSATTPAPTTAPAATTTVAPTGVATIAATPPPQMAGELALVETGVADMQGYLQRGEVSAVALVEAAEARVNRLDERYGAIMEMNPDAREIARRLDEERAQGSTRGPLHGVPIVVKDILATADAMRTTAGALALADNPVAEDAAVIRRLREAGAIVLGKTNMTEWSNVRSAGQVGGWSDRGGWARNPYDPEMATWGSSSGSAAAVALSYAPLALGAETNGSIICPAAACGVVGLKPTVGLVSRVGAIPVTTTLDSIGPMGRSVADVAALMNVIAGYDAEDPAYGEMGWLSPASTAGASAVHAYDEVDYLAALVPNGLQGARIGVCWGIWGFDPDTDLLAEEVLYRLQDAGAELVLNVAIPSLQALKNAPGIGTVVNTEFTVGVGSFFARFMPDAPVRSLQDVVDWNSAHADVALAMNGQDGLTESLEPLTLSDPAYQDAALNLITEARENGMDAALDEFEVDVLLAPSAPVPTALADNDFAGSSTQMSALSGYPSITVPIGAVNGLPVGLHLSGRAFDERTLLRIARGVEEVIAARVAPVVE